MKLRQPDKPEKTVGQMLALPLLAISFIQAGLILLILYFSRTLSDLDSVRAWIVLASLLALLLAGIYSTVRVYRLFIRPVIKLGQQIRQQNPVQPASLTRTGILELDELIGDFEQMRVSAAAASARMSSTIDLVGLRLASFEEWPEHMTVYVSDTIFDLMDAKSAENSSSQISLGRWNEMMFELLSKPDPAYSDVYIWQPAGSTRKRWLRLRLAGQTDRMAGILMDVTEEIQRHRRLELERDYDALTHLLNKPAFLDQCSQSLESMKQGQAAVMLFSDLDNLKKINDQYGHKFGDRYIQMAANVFGQFRRHQGLAARLSGDEFAVFLTGHDEYSSKDELRQLISSVFAETSQQKLAVPDEKQIALRMSVGLAWYPDDADKIGELLNLADFAMYQIKKDGKAGLHEFTRDEYLHNQSLMENRTHLDQLLTGRQLECVAQPVVDARTAEIIGYAMTMRPLHSRIRLPLEVIELARQQNRLDDLERLMVELCSRWAETRLGHLEPRKIFFSSLNGLASQIATDGWPAEILAPLQGRLVVDINGSENYNEKDLRQMVDFLSSQSGQLAISQFRTSNDESELIAGIQPDFIRLDHTVIRDIDKDTARQQLLANRVSYCVDRGIRLIAEGIETEAEMNTAILLGADYLQGYYLGRPQSLAGELPDGMMDQIRSARKLS